jgi:hypothetical protein
LTFKKQRVSSINGIEGRVNLPVAGSSPSGGAKTESNELPFDLSELKNGGRLPCVLQLLSEDTAKGIHVQRTG